MEQAKQIAASLQHKLARSEPVLKVELDERKDLPVAMVHLAEAETLTQVLSLQPPGTRIGSVEVERIEPAKMGTKTLLVKWKGRKDALNEDALCEHFNALLSQAPRLPAGFRPSRQDDWRHKMIRITLKHVGTMA